MYSFVLPAYKAYYLKEAIDSILAQTYKNFELIIVNDASPEDLDSIVNSYDDFRIRYYINEKNIGGEDLVAQWNYCIQYAKGDFIILASDDDKYSPLYLERMDELVHKYSEANVFRPRIELIDNNGNVFCTLGEVSECISRIEFLHYWMKSHIGSGIPYYIFRKKSLDDIGGFKSFPLAWFSDDATVFELSKNGLIFCNEVLFSFRFSGINITTKRNSKKLLAYKLKALMIFDKWIWPLINKEEVSSENDLRLVENIKSDWSLFIRHKAYDLLNHSSFKAIYSNIKLLNENPYLSWSWIIFVFFKLSVKKLLRYNRD